MKTIIYTFLLLSILLNLSSCKTRYIEVPVETIKKEEGYIDRWNRDSIFVQDSVFFAIKGDTIYKEKYKYIYKDRIMRDSVYISDSIYVEKPIPVDVPVPYYPKFLVILSSFGVLAFLYLLYKLFRLF